MSRLHPDEVTRRHGIPVTTVARTLLDLATSVRADEMERSVSFAYRSGLTTHGEMNEIVARHQARPGVRTLRRMLANGSEPLLTRSEAERLALTLIGKAGLDRPASNVPLEGFEVDLLWRAQRLVVEIDGFAFHSSAGDFERDRRRDAVLTAAGYRVLRVTWRQLTREREALIARLAAALVR